MLHDTSKTFRDIHGTPSALAAELEKIVDISSRRFRLPRNANHPQLRFLAPLEPQPVDNSSVVHLRLTSPHEYTKKQRYVAVSYTWEQSASLVAAFGDCVPTYKIWTSKAEPRAPNCNPIVLHRACRFAQEKLDRALIWIDQECIQQDDPEDVEAHLQAMHEIYRRSAYTAVLLSQTIDSVSTAAGLIPFMQDDTRVFDRVLAHEDCEIREQCFRALQYLAKDRWFTRTWTYQERFFANACHYLVPVSQALGAIDRIPVSGLDDWYISERSLVDFVERIKRGDLSRISHLRINLNPNATNQGCLKCLQIIIETMRLVDRNFEASRSINEKVHLPAFQDLGVSLMGIATPKDVQRKVAQYYGTANQDVLLIRGMLQTANLVFGDMELCDNAVVSDRVSIFANVCQYGWTLQTVKLRNEDVSYSTCILALILLNVFRWKDTAALERRAEEVMAETIGDFLSSVVTPFSMQT